MPFNVAKLPADTVKSSGTTSAVGAASALPAVFAVTASGVNASSSVTEAVMLTSPATAVIVRLSSARLTASAVPVKVRPPSSSWIIPSPVGNTETSKTPPVGVKRTVSVLSSKSAT